MRTLMIKVSELGIRRAANTLVITLFSVLLPITSLQAQGAGDTSYDGTTAWGDPDLQGLWTNETRTPMERPVELGNKAFFTEEDVQAMRAAAEPAPGMNQKAAPARRATGARASSSSAPASWPAGRSHTTACRRPRQYPRRARTRRSQRSRRSQALSQTSTAISPALFRRATRKCPISQPPKRYTKRTSSFDEL